MVSPDQEAVRRVLRQLGAHRARGDTRHTFRIRWYAPDCAAKCRSRYHAAPVGLFIGMPALQELRAAGMAALHLPHALRSRGCGSVQHVAERNARYPVLLVHGYAAS